MKKTYILVFTMLLALVILSCDFGPINAAKSEVQYTADGRRLVELTLNIDGGARALTDTLAKAGVDFYEVSFKSTASGSAIHRAYWDFAQTGRIQLPADTYTNTPTTSGSILFAGRQSDKTLLAVGVVSSIGKVNASNVIIQTGIDVSASEVIAIDAETRNITFTLMALTTDVHGRVQGTSGATGSSFNITAPLATVGPPPTPSYSTYSVYENAVLPFVKFNNQNIPIFAIPKSLS